jgi:hypothetical protein
MSPRIRRTREARLTLARQLKGEYYSGASIRGLAREHDLSYGTVRNLLLLADSRLRKRGGGLPRPIVEDAQAAGSAS